MNIPSADLQRATVSELLGRFRQWGGAEQQLAVTELAPFQLRHVEFSRA
jgi:hypothetical protein